MLKKIKFIDAEHFSRKNSVEIAGVNDSVVSLVKASGESSWYLHEDQDKFLVAVSGSLVVHYEGSSLELAEQEGVMIPRNVIHRIVASRGSLFLLFEPKPSWRDNKNKECAHRKRG